MHETQRRAAGALAFNLLCASAQSTAAVGLGVLASSLAPVCVMAQSPDEAPPQQVTLSQAQIDGMIAAQKDVHALEGAGTQEKPDSAMAAKMTAIAKAHGFDSLAQFSAVTFSVGLVMAGIDPDTKTFVGPVAVIHKQIEQVKADKSMPPKDKKDALDELNGALQQGNIDTPLPANIALVQANFDKLSEAMQPAD